MARLHEMEVLIVVVDAGSFARAGARQRIPPPVVTRAASSLEDRIGTQLPRGTTVQPDVPFDGAGQRRVMKVSPPAG